jgi:hypothetical protein
MRAINEATRHLKRRFSLHGYRPEEGARLSLVSLVRLIAQSEFDAAMYPASSRARHDR